jgi:hypothetical protein
MPAFDRLRVDYVVVGGARVSWDLNRHFIDPGPYTFQLQVGHTGLEQADDWLDVGDPIVDTYFAFDLDQRLFGKLMETHYRVRLVTPVGTYYSNPQSTEGVLSTKDWLAYREIARKEQLRHRVQTSPIGFLLKARRYGPRCPVCADQFTEEVTRTNCTTCYGTGFLNGYFAPLSACYADVSLQQNREHRDPNVGMQKQDVITARFIGDPQLYSYDVWINGASDERYYFHTVSSKAHVRGVDLIFEAELRLAPFTDVIYQLPITSQPIPPLTLKTKQEVACQPAAKPARPGLNYLEAAFRELKAKRKRGRSSRR